MNPQKLLLSILGLALVAAGAWFALGLDGDGGRDRDGSRGAAATAPPSNADSPPEADLTAAEAAPPSDTVTAPTDVEATRREAVTTAPARGWEAPGEQWLEGQVALPPGTPEDEVVFVLALNGRTSAARLNAGVDRAPGGPAEEAWRERPKVTAPLWSIAAVEADGSFRIALPADESQAHLALSGRYVFSRGTQVVELPAPEGATLTGELGAWVTGRVTTPAGSVAPETGVVGLGADLSGGIDPEKLRAEAWEHRVSIGPDGTFDVRGVNPAITRAIGVEIDGLATEIVLGLDLRPGERREVDIAVSLGATLRGRVVDAGGGAVANAEVQVAGTGVMGRIIGALGEDECDAAGAFELVNVPAGGVEFTVKRDGYRTLRKVLDSEVRDGDVLADLVLVMDRGATVSGRVVHGDGAPAPGAGVTAWLPPNMFGGMESMQPRRISRVEAGADGRFTISGLGGGRHDFEATVEGDGRFMARATGVTAGTADLELVLFEMVPVMGRVTDAEGTPITAFEVIAAREGGAMFGMPGAVELFPFEDEGGGFTLASLSPGNWKLEVRAPGFGLSDEQPIEVPRGPDAEELLFVLERSAAVEGVVLDAAGAPAPGAQVTLELGLVERMKAASTGGIPEVRCDGEGRFRMENVDPGGAVLVAKQPGFASSEPVEVAVTSNQVTSGVVLHLREGGTLTGELFGDDGEPDAGRTVIVQRLHSYSPQYLPVTEADGTFVSEHLEPGRWQVVTSGDFMTGDPDRGAEEAMADFMADMKTEFVEIKDGETTHVVLGAPAEEPVRFFGRVVHGGEPVQGTMVIVLPNDAASLAAMKMATTGSEGQFEFTLDQPGEVTVSIQQGVGLGQQNNIERIERIPSGVTEHELVIELPQGRISGRVLGPDGAPLSEARVTLHKEGGVPVGSFLGTRYADTTTDAEGRYDLLYVDPGVYTIGAGGVIMGGALGGESSGGRVLKSGLSVGEGQWLDDVDFRLKTPGTLRGRVVDEAGMPAPNATVFLRDAGGRLVENFSMLTSDATGRFVVDSLAPGNYTVHARDSARASADSPAVFIQSEQTSDATVMLTQGTVLVITVLDQKNQDAEAVISAVDGEGRDVGMMRSMNEMVDLLALDPDARKHRLGPLPPGKYTVTAKSADGLKASRPVTVTGQKERKVKLRLR